MSKLFKRTKILATVGPSVFAEEKLREMVYAGVNGFRMNFSHGGNEEKVEQIRLIRKYAAERGKAVAILQDLQGPKIRLGVLKDNHLDLKAGDEVVLDYAVEVSREAQKEVFRRQLELAERRGLPVVIHCVKAFNDVITELKLHDLQAVVFHGFIGSPEQAAEAVRLGYFLSFNMRSLSSPKTIESLRRVPLTSIFAETDTEPEHVSQVYEKIAEVRGITIEQLQAYIAENFNRIF